MHKKLALLLPAFCLFGTLAAGAACASNEPLKAPENFMYDGEVLTWDAVENAESYEIVVDGGEPVSVTGTSYSYDAASLTFTASVQAISERGEEYDSALVTVDFKPLSDVRNVHMDEDGVLVWDLVENATAYYVSVNNAVTLVDVNEFTQLKSGLNAVRVRAAVKGDNSYYSKWTQVQNYTLLDTPQRLRYVKDEDKIAWDAVRGAGSYTLKINEREYTVNGTSYEYMPGTGEFVISVRANAPAGAADVFASAFSESVDYEYLPPVEGLDERDGAVVWSALEGGRARYQVEVTQGSTVSNYVTLDTARYEGLRPGVLYSLRVRILPENERQYSTWSDPFPVYFLTAPTVEVLGQNGDERISFAISAANGEASRVQDCTIRIRRPDGTVLDYKNASLNSFNEYAFNEGAGEYTFEVKVNPKTLRENYEFSSAYSEPVRIVRLADVKGVRMTESEQIAFDAVSGAQGYRYVVDGAETGIGMATTFSLTVNNSDGRERIVSVSLSAVGSDGQNVGGKYYLASSTPYTFRVTKLATPAKPDITDNRIQWTGVSNANGYQVLFGGDGGAGDVTQQVTDTGCTAAFETAGSHEVKVRAKGTPSAFILSSEYSEVLTVYKLAAPYVTQITPEGILRWTYTPAAGMSANGTGYVISVGSTSREVDIDSNEYDLSAIASLAPQRVSVIVRGNGKEIVDSDPMTDTVSVAKLDVVKNLALRNAEGSIVWDAVANARNYRFTYVTAGQTKNVDAAATAYGELGAWAPGEYTVTVRALGYKAQTGNTYYVQSDAVTNTFTKLEAPVVERSGSVYTWNSVSFAQNGYSVLRAGRDPERAMQNGSLWEYAPAFTRSDLSAGELTLEFITNGSDSTNLIDSSAAVVRQKVSALTAPSLTVDYVQDGSGQAFRLTAAATYAEASYCFLINGSEQAAQKENVFTHAVSAGTYTYSVYAKGGFFKDDIYYVDSEQSAPIAKTVLRPVRDVTHEFADGELTLRWVNPNGGGTCRVETDKGAVKSMTATACVITGLTSGQTVTVTIRAEGNGSTTFTSEAVTETITIS